MKTNTNASFQEDGRKCSRGSRVFNDLKGTIEFYNGDFSEFIVEERRERTITQSMKFKSETKINPRTIQKGKTTRTEGVKNIGEGDGEKMIFLVLEYN